MMLTVLIKMLSISPRLHCGIYKYEFDFSDRIIYQSFLHTFNLSISHYLIVFN